jgi:hypothetical protein
MVSVGTARGVVVVSWSGPELYAISATSRITNNEAVVLLNDPPYASTVTLPSEPEENFQAIRYGEPPKVPSSRIVHPAGTPTVPWVNNPMTIRSSAWYEPGTVRLRVLDDVLLVVAPTHVATTSS